MRRDPKGVTCKRLGATLSLLLFCASFSWALTSSEPKPDEPTVLVPVRKLKEWESSLRASAASAKSYEQTTSELKSKLVSSNETIASLERSLSTLESLQASSASEIESLSSTLLDWKTRYEDLESTSTELRLTSEALSLELRKMKSKRIRDAILAFLAGLGAGTAVGVIAE